MFNDIYEIESLGPLLILYNFPDRFRGSLWIHFVDNAADLARLVKGSPSVLSGDRIVGWTWSRIWDLEVLPWFDRVESASNPVDGLSRGDMAGPWVLVPVSYPGEVLRG